jgi:hypothetical protein
MQHAGQTDGTITTGIFTSTPTILVAVIAVFHVDRHAGAAVAWKSLSLAR